MRHRFLRIGFRSYRKKYKTFFPQNWNLSWGLDLLAHVSKVPNHLVAQSLYIVHCRYGVCSRSCALRCGPLFQNQESAWWINRPQGPGDPVRAQGASLGRPQQPHSHPGRRQQDEERLDLSSPHQQHQRTRLFSDETYLGSWPLLCVGQQPQRMRFTVHHCVL